MFKKIKNGHKMEMLPFKNDQKKMTKSGIDTLLNDVLL